MTAVQEILQKFNSLTPPDFDDWLLDNKQELIRLELCAIEESYKAGFDARDEDNSLMTAEQIDKLFKQWYARYINY